MAISPYTSPKKPRARSPPPRTRSSSPQRSRPLNPCTIEATISLPHRDREAPKDAPPTTPQSQSRPNHTALTSLAIQPPSEQESPRDTKPMPGNLHPTPAGPEDAEQPSHAQDGYTKPMQVPHKTTRPSSPRPIAISSSPSTGSPVPRRSPRKATQEAHARWTHTPLNPHGHLTRRGLTQPCSTPPEAQETRTQAP